MASNKYGGRLAHPAAEVFPMRDETRIKELADDIRENGLREPVTEHWDGRLLDGRARVLACDLAGVPVLATQYTGNDPWGHAITRNLATRQPTPDEATFIAVRLPYRNPNTGFDTTVEYPPPRGRVAELMHISKSGVARAKPIVDHGIPELEECVLKYGVPMYTAARIAELPVEKQHEVVANIRGGMSAKRAAPRRATTPAMKRGPRRPANQFVHPDWYRYIQRDGLAAVRDSMAVLRVLIDTTEGLSPEIDAAEAARWLNDLGRERRNLNRLITLLKERTQ